MVKLFVLPLLLLIGSGHALRKSISAEVKIFTNVDLIGYSRKFRTYVNDLNLEGLSDAIRSANMSGIWIFYEDTEYNKYNFSNDAYFGWGKNHVVNSFGSLNGKISSLRFAGSDQGLKINSINLYEGPGFMGGEQFYFKDVQKFTDVGFGESIIISGCKPWTLYSETNFEGQRICLYPTSTDNCEPSFFMKPENFGNFGNKGSSARVGCFSDKIVRGMSIPENTARSFKANA